MGHWVDQGFIANTLQQYKTELQDICIDAFGEDFLLDEIGRASCRERV